MIISPTKYLLYYGDGRSMQDSIGGKLSTWSWCEPPQSLISLRLGRVGVIAGSSIYTHYLSSESNPMDHIERELDNGSGIFAITNLTRKYRRPRVIFCLHISDYLESFKYLWFQRLHLQVASHSVSPPTASWVLQRTVVSFSTKSLKVRRYACPKWRQTNLCRLPRAWKDHGLRYNPNNRRWKCFPRRWLPPQDFGAVHRSLHEGTYAPPGGEVVQRGSLSNFWSSGWRY